MTDDQVIESDTPDSGPSPVFPVRWLVILIAVATLLRLAMAGLSSEDLQRDPDAYVRLANTLVRHGAYAQPGGEVPTAFRPPLYPGLLAGLLEIGVPPSYAVTGWNLVGCLVQVVAVVCIGRFVLLSRSWTFLGAVGVAFDPLQIRYSVLAMTECVAGGLLAVAVLFLFRASRQESVWVWVVAGVFFGFGTLCRPICMICMVFLLGGMLCQQFRSGGPLRPIAVRIVCCSVAAGFVLTPWVIRNAVKFGAFIPATTHGGYTLLLGNNRVFFEEVVNGPSGRWHGESLEQWQQEMKTRAVADGVELRDEVAMDRWYYRQSRIEISGAPGSFLKACILRLSRFFAVTGGADQNLLIRVACGIWYSCVGLGLVVSLLACYGRRTCETLRSDIQILWLAIGSFVVMHTVYWANARMRTPLTVVICILSAIGWRWLLQRKQDKPLQTE